MTPERTDRGAGRHADRLVQLPGEPPNRLTMADPIDPGRARHGLRPKRQSLGSDSLVTSAGFIEITFCGGIDLSLM